MPDQDDLEIKEESGSAAPPGTPPVSSPVTSPATSPVTSPVTQLSIPSPALTSDDKKYVANTIKLPADQLAALQMIWLELKRLYGSNSPDKSGMIQQAVADWLKRWDGPDRQELLRDLLEIRQDTRRRQYKKTL